MFSEAVMTLPDLIPMTINSKNSKADIANISALILLLQMAHLAKLIKGIKKGKKMLTRGTGVWYIIKALTRECSAP